MELVDRVLCLPGERSLGKEGLGKLQGSLHNGALQGQKIHGKNPTIPYFNNRHVYYLRVRECGRLCFDRCVFIWMCVIRITQKVLNRIPWNLVG